MESKVFAYLRDLAGSHRVLLLGGHAIIFHGLTRTTTDSDVWLEPMASAKEWVRAVHRVTREFPAAYFWDLAARRKCDALEVASVVQDFGVIRIGGLEEPLYIFRRPNNFGEEQFDATWEMSASLPDEKVRVFSSIDLLVSKADSERETDQLDVRFLEGKVRQEFRPILATCPPEEALSLFARYADHETCRSALANPHPEVRALAVETLRELADGQNPFAREILAGLDAA